MDGGTLFRCEGDYLRIQLLRFRIGCRAGIVIAAEVELEEGCTREANDVRRTGCQHRVMQERVDDTILVRLVVGLVRILVEVLLVMSETFIVVIPQEGVGNRLVEV